MAYLIDLSKRLGVWLIAMLSSIEFEGVVQSVSAIVGLIAGVAAYRYYTEARRAKETEIALNEIKLKKLNGKNWKGARK
jgi:hypothetical protein